MKKIKLQFKYDELHEVYADLFNNAISLTTGTKNYYNIIVSALLVNLYTKLANKVLFKTDKKIKLSLDVATACALVVFISHKDLNPANYIDNVYIRLQTEIDQQLS